MERAAADHLAGLDPGPLEAAGLRREDKGPIQALHWRGAADEASAEALAREIADAAARAGLEPHWGRKVLELRPPGGGGKAAAVSALIESGEGITAAAYAGDDRTDLDAFRRLRQMRDSGRLARAICVGIASEEGPAEIREEADLEVSRPGRVDRDPPRAGELRCRSPICCAPRCCSPPPRRPRLGAITAIAAGRSDDTRTITVAAVWWAIAVVAGLYLGRPQRAADGVRDALAAARTATSLPPESPSRIALARLWPVGVTALIAGGLGLFFPQSRRDRRRLRPAGRARLADPRGGGARRRAARRNPLLRRADLRPSPDCAYQDARASAGTGHPPATRPRLHQRRAEVSRRGTRSSTRRPRACAAP